MNITDKITITNEDNIEQRITTYLLRLFNVVGRSEQLVCPECDSVQVIEFFPTHNKRTCFECKHEWAK